jgi:H(+)-transporting ATP synthase, vacuolar type, subunit D
MAILNVNPTRMVLTQLKKRLKTASRGHKLMKDKRDELVKRFIELARENKVLRDSVESRITEVYAGMTIARAVMHKEVMDESLMYPKQGVEVTIDHESIMSVRVPVFDFIFKSPNDADIYPYGFSETSGELDGAIKRLSDIFPDMLELAAIEKKIALLAEEVEKTRRRVNALEYIVIPNLQDTIRYIRMKLDENERGNQTRLIKVKDMILIKAIKNKSLKV